MQLLNQKRVLWASEPNVATPSDAVETLLTTATADITYQQVRTHEINRDLTVVEIARVRGSVSGVKHGVSKERCSVSMEIPMLAWPAADEPPHYGVMLKAMGMKETIAAGSVTYTPSTVQQSAATIYSYQRNAENNNYRLQVATGVRGNGVLNLAVGAEPFWAFTGTGQYHDLTEAKPFFAEATGEVAFLKDGTTPVTARTTGDESYADQAPMMCKCMTITVAGKTWQISELTMDLGWSVDEVDTINGCSARHKGLLTKADSGGRVTLSFNLQDYNDALLTEILDYVDDGNEVTFSAELGNVEGKITINAGKMQIGNPEGGATGNLQTYSIPGYLNGNWTDLRADNDFSITYSAAP